MTAARLLVGDVFERMAELDDHSFDLILTSPPFLALRSYLPDGHPDKAKEIGSEATPAEFLDTMLVLTAEWRRLLAPHGSIAVELGDTYAGSGGAGGDYGPGGIREGEPKAEGSAKYARIHPEPPPGVDPRTWRPLAVSRAGRNLGGGAGWPLDKSLTGIPTLYTWSLAYGRNLLTGQPSPAGMWRIRNLKPWIRSNPPVGALGDKERPATSYITVATLSRDRWFDLDAVRTPPTHKPQRFLSPDTYRRDGRAPGSDGRPPETEPTNRCDPAGAPPLDWWHHVDAVIDAEIDRRAGKRQTGGLGNDKDSAAAYPGGGGDVGRGHNSRGSETTGARGVHIRRALEAAGILTTHDALDVSPKGYAGAHYACVDDQTEALTPRGWKRHTDLRDGDLIAVWSPDTETWRFEPATIHRYPFAGELVAIDKRVTNQRLTPNHRVAYRTRKDRTPRFRQASTLTAGCQIPVAASMDDGGVGPGEKAAALAGWFCTEGSLSDWSQWPIIHQSESANPQHVQAIRSLLDGLDADYSETRRDRIGVTGKAHITVDFRIRGPLAEWLRQFHKVLPMSAVFGWSPIDARALFNAMVDGDGNRRADGRMSFIQKDLAVAEAFQMLALRLGYRTTLTRHRVNDCYVVHVSPARWIDLRAGYAGREPATSLKRYEGVVWCPQVSTGAWVARRNGQPFITGNTWPPELVRLLIDEMCPRHVCTTCGQPRRRIIEQTPEYAAFRQRANAGDRPTTAWDAASGNRAQGLGGAEPADSPARGQKHVTLGWSDCGHNTWRPGHVLDPFAGSGTTLAVATGMARTATGIDLDPRNADLALERCGMFLEIDHGTEGVVA